MLQTTMKSASSETSNTVWPSTNIVHLAGTLFTSSLPTTVSSWIIDSGATDHITANLDILINPIQCNALLHLLNGNTISVTHVGSVSLSPGITLQQVLCVPGFTHNLLSISKLLKDTNFTATFSGESCYVQDPTWKRVQEIGKVKDGLYVLNSGLEGSSASSQSILPCCNM